MNIYSLRRNVLACALATATLSWGASSAFAQVLEEVIVTAQKRAESVQEVPISISVTTGEQLARDQIYQLIDLQRTTPALEVNTSVGGENGGARIRGVGTNLFAEGASGSVAIVVDQVPGGNIAMPQLFDIAQVEVLKGPQGTLFGQTASMGVLNVSTAAPDTENFSANIGADYLFDDYDRTLIRGAVNIPLSDNTAVRIAGRFVNIEGLQRNEVLNADNEKDEYALRARLRSNPTDSFQIDLIAEYQKEDEDGANFFGPALPATQTVPGGPPPEFLRSPEYANQNTVACGASFNDAGRSYCSDLTNIIERDYFNATAILEWELDNYSVTSVTSYRNKDIAEEFVDLSRVSDGISLGVFNQGKDGTQVSQEFRLTSNFDGPFNFIAGVYTTDYDYDLFPLVDSPFQDCATPIGNTFRINTTGVCPFGPPDWIDSDVESSSDAVFFDATFDLSESLRVFGGLRYTDADTSFELSRNGGPIENTGGTDSQETTGRLGLRLTTSDSTTIYWSVSTGFKPAFVSVPEAPGAEADILDPELSTSFEVGAKFSLMDDKLLVNANAFLTQVDDYQAQGLGFVNSELVAIPTNIDIESKGFEVEAIGNITDNLSINTGFIYNNVEYPKGFLDDTEQDIGGEQLALAPETKFTLSGNYFQSIGSGMEAFVNINAVHKDDIKLVARIDPNYHVDAQWNLGANIGVRSADGKWTASLFGRNLTDEKQTVVAFPTLSYGQDNGGVRVFPVEGYNVRQVGVTVDYNF